MQILFPGSKSAPDMPFGFIGIQYLACLRRKSRIDLKEPLGHVLMYSTFADSEFFCRLPYSGVAFYDIIGDFYGAFFNIIFQENPPANIVFTMYAGKFGCMSIFCSCLVHLRLHAHDLFDRGLQMIDHYGLGDMGIHAGF